jgi:hypothetical protein
MKNDCRRWPVAFRPQCGELLYSWLARTAGVYGLCPEELLPQHRRFDAISLLVHETSPEILKSLAAAASISTKALARHTLAGAYPNWPSSWCVADDTTLAMEPVPSLQICPRCIADANAECGVQSLRLIWQCSALTICRKHLTPLQKACIHCHWIGWPICSRIAFHRFRFFCRHCGNPLEGGAYSFYDTAGAAVRLLVRFENQLLRALAKQAVEWCWIGYATPQEFLLLIEDLLWARAHRQRRPSVKCVQVHQ